MVGAASIHHPEVLRTLTGGCEWTGGCRTSCGVMNMLLISVLESHDHTLRLLIRGSTSSQAHPGAGVPKRGPDVCESALKQPSSFL